MSFKKNVFYFLTPVYNIEIDTNLESGIHIGNNIVFTNNNSIIKEFATETLKKRIGEIEYDSLMNANGVFYKVLTSDFEGKFDKQIKNHKKELLEFLYLSQSFISLFWLIKDNSVNIEIGYTEFFKFVSENSIESTFGSTNHLGVINTFANGDKKNQKFKFDDLNKILEYSKFLKPTEYTKFAIDPSPVYNNNPRIGIALASINIARGQHDLALKIGHYCTFFESIFSTSNTEITHKLAERIAFFTELLPELRYKRFQEIKDIYSVRSQVVHGSNVSSKKLKSINDLVNNTDNIARIAINKILNNRFLLNLFSSRDNKKLDDYFNKLIFGMN
ncbi:HEPN domain-containing protein [Aquimarina sp. AU58]|uniref:HEPN domain-containing protein n=1 Tax=Aquimarina sp. AU58 TaxID=1874112 RepID=UPI000D6EA2E3|nr:HEPN domain-containing protein [Aquimarina sp. AU58]